MVSHIIQTRLVGYINTMPAVFSDLKLYLTFPAHVNLNSPALAT